MQIWIIHLVLSTGLILLTVILWILLFPKPKPKPFPESDDNGDNNSGLPVMPLSPYSPEIEWLTDRYEKSTESKRAPSN